MQKLHLVGLSKISKLGPKTSRALISYCGGAQQVFRASREQLLSVPGVGGKIATNLLSQRSLSAAEEEMQFADRHKIEVISYLDAEYPQTLKNCHDAPLVIYKRGESNLNSQPAVSIVGTRKPSSEGRDIARKFATTFSHNGFNVVSGLAFGIDGEAHGAAMRARGQTTAVLGHGLDQIYPRSHTGLARKILESGGALLTEFPSGIGPEAYNFPARNRIISGMSYATIVIEAREKGGAQITARFAFDQNREVYAVPGALGSTTSVGCNRLIRDQVAKLVTDPEEILDDLAMIVKLKERYKGPEGVDPPLDEADKGLITVLKAGAAKAEEVAEKAHMTLDETYRRLLDMELNGLVRKGAGNNYKSAV